MLSIRATRAGAAGRLCLAACLLAALACASQHHAPGAPLGAPVPLTPEGGTTVTGSLQLGDTAIYALPLKEGEYFEIHLDRTPEEATAYLYQPDVEPTSGAPYTYTERFPDTPGQVLWEVAETPGVHHLRVQSEGEEPVSYRLTVTAVRAASSRDWSRHRCIRAFNDARSLETGGQLEQALARYRETLRLCREGEYPGGIASTLGRSARCLESFGRHEEARQHFEAALEAWRAIGQPHSVAGTLIRWAGLERRLANWDRAEELLEEGLRIARATGLQGVEANGLDQYCRLLIEYGNTDRARDLCQEAVATWEQLGDLPSAVDSLNNLGYIYRYGGELNTARVYYLRALNILDKHPERGKQATLRNNLALISETEGEYQKALAEYHQAAEGHEAVGRYSDAGVALQNIGEIYQHLGKLDTALDYFHHALKLLEQGADPLGRIEVLHSLGDLHQERGELSEARRVLGEALEQSRRAGASPYLAGSLAHMGKLRLTEGRAPEAVALLEEALELCRKTGDRWGETDALTHLARALTRLGGHEEALDLLYRAADVSEEIGDRTGTAESYYEISRIERRRGNLEAARSAVEQSLGVVDSIRTLVGSDDLRTLFTATARPYHELYIDVLMAQHERRPEGGHDAEALRAAEDSRAQSLLEILSESELDPGSEVPGELLAERTSLQQRLNAKEIERQNLLAEEETDPAALFRVKLDLEGILTDLRQVELDIRTASPRYAALTRPQPVSVGEIQRSVLDGETALFEYSLGEERSFLWVVSEDAFHTYELPGRDEIDPLARCLHWLIANYGVPPPPDELEPEEAVCLGDRLDAYRSLPASRHSLQVRAHRRGQVQAAFEELAPQLSDLLLAGPARDGLLLFRLAVVSDGALEYVPFETLPHPEARDRPLVRTHQVVRQPSASVLAFQRSHSSFGGDPRGTLAIVADPVYGPNDERVVGRGRGREEVQDGASRSEEGGLTRRYARLPFAGQEADLIARYAPRERTFVARGTGATRETVLGGALSGYRYVHFATHGTIDTRFPELSSLVLSQVDARGRARPNGLLLLHEIYGLELDEADMVVLSACETALGREVRGEGLVGLTRGFLYAGAESVVASLWQVQDRTTAHLMDRFYRGLLEDGSSPADSLRHAQLAILDEPGGSRAYPYYWAGFVLQGEWR